MLVHVRRRRRRCRKRRTLLHRTPRHCERPLHGRVLRRLSPLEPRRRLAFERRALRLHEAVRTAARPYATASSSSSTAEEAPLGGDGLATARGLSRGGGAGGGAGESISSATSASAADGDGGGGGALLLDDLCRRRAAE